jgi:hypothetical protein
MSNIKVSYLKIDIKSQILDYNKNFVEFFGLQNKKLSELKLADIIQTLNPNVYNCIKSLKLEESKNVLLFKTCNSLSTLTPDSVVILYAIMTRVNDGYTILFVNWLNWINNLYSSLENGFTSIANLDEEEFKSKINYLSETYWFKALLPLITHTPKSLLGQISSHVLFKILRIFNNKRGANYFSKDYNRDTISRIKNHIKQTTGVVLPNIKMLVENTSLVDLHRGGQIVIRETSLNEDILIFPKKDELLEFLIFKLAPKFQ